MCKCTRFVSSYCCVIYLLSVRWYIEIAMNKKTIQNNERSLGVPFLEDIEADIAALPPEVDDQSDKDGIAADDIGRSDVTDVPGTVECGGPGDYESEYLSRIEVSFTPSG
ncbi:unnamed protein product [Diabrotica balteata]|uniref:Uncharacterized protein n=1 Tax=Diabrotica balteata TaxID=107213 RepID=A0A9N9SPE2_DIABA|nr:unnamed protein product [Diabrotica balteata]